MEPFGLVADLGAMRSNETVVASTSSKDISPLFVYNTLEEQAAGEEVFFEAAERIDIDLCMDTKAFRILHDSFQVGQC